MRRDGSAVTILSRKDAGHTGSFTVNVKLGCDANGYPAGALTISGISMTDSTIQGTITNTLAQGEQQPKPRTGGSGNELRFSTGVGGAQVTVRNFKGAIVLGPK